MIAGVRSEELIFSGIVSGSCWGTLSGLFVIGMSYDPPAPRRQAIMIMVISASIFAFLGASIHLAVSKIYQNKPDDTRSVPLLQRIGRVLVSAILTPLAFATLTLFNTLHIRRVRNQSLDLVKSCTRKKNLIIFAVSAIALQLIFSNLFANSDEPTPLLSKKCALQCTSSCAIAATATFFASSFF